MRNHFSTSMCPPFATAEQHFLPSHGQPFSCNHCNSSICPPSAAYAHVFLSHGQPFALKFF